MTDLFKALQLHPTFGKLKEEHLSQLSQNSVVITIRQGEVICRQDIIEDKSFIVLDGSFRLLARNVISNELYTIGKGEKDSIIGLVDLLRQSPCEIALARQVSTVIGIDNNDLLKILNIQENFDILKSIQSPCEDAELLLQLCKI